MCKQISWKYIRNMHGPYIGKKKRNGKNQIIQYLLGLGAAVVLIDVMVVSGTKMIKQTTVKYKINILSNVNDVLYKLA